MPNPITQPLSRKKKIQLRQEQLERMLRALAEFHERPPALVTRDYVKSLANRHLVHYKTMIGAIQLDMELELEGREQ